MIKNRSFIWNTIGTALNSFLSLFLLIIITRINGLELSGAFSFVFSLTLLLQIISNYGGRIYQISDLKDEFHFQIYLGSKIKTSIVSIIILIIMCFFFKIKPLICGVAMCLMILRIIETFSDVFYASFQKNDHLDYVGISLTIKSCLILIIFLILDKLTHNILISSIGIIIASLTTFIFYDLSKIKTFERISFSFNDDLYKKSKYIFLFSLVTMLILNIPRFVANYNLSSNEIGYLGILMMIPTVMALICQFIIQPQLVGLTKAYYNQKISLLKKILKNCFILLICFSIICLILAVTVGPFVLEKLYNISFEEYRIVFLVLILAGTFNGITSIFSNVLTIFRKTEEQFNMYLIILVLNAIITYLLSKFYGLNELLIGFMLVMLFQCIIFYFMYRKQLYLLNK